MLETSSEHGRFDRVRGRIERDLLEHNIPSLSVAVAQGQTILWEESFGWADRERRIPATPHTMYSLASISKPITATGLMILKERGLLHLDHPINDYLGDSKLRAGAGSPEQATVRRVANHTAGLPLHYQFFYQDEPYLPPSMDETIRRYGYLVTEPGERYQYSNLGYGILGEVIARLSGKSYADFLREEVFLPLGMLRASVDIGAGLEEFQARRYESDGSLYPFYDCDHPGASSVYCSAHDLLRFGMFHLKQHLADQKAILSDEALDEMQVASAHSSDVDGYGIGWSIYDGIPDHYIVGHGGGMGGVSTLLRMLPASQTVVVVLTNTSETPTHLVNQVAVDILSVLQPAYGEKRARAEEQRQQAQADKSEADFRPDAHLLGQWEGMCTPTRVISPLLSGLKRAVISMLSLDHS
ncbi:serine hydrolase domain-containing protein [Dictyobacter kobayashii]|uniref:Serine hydrolase n=1 Tax=Dictyobacter kobayashii TaxID=2014872 RepID=A0A402AQ59_9CHLR|nr:serine hydrolase domain-containing protein [Dictyobacter kobayashii]GCE21184.1 serine hydrolase [Dictyobacter kobayashii]